MNLPPACSSRKDQARPPLQARRQGQGSEMRGFAMQVASLSVGPRAAACLVLTVHAA